MYRNSILVVSTSCLLAMAAGCPNGSSKVGSAEAPAVPVSHPAQRMVKNYVYYTGRTNAVKSVVVQARVTGYLVKMPNKEGADVKEGDVLFEVDPSPYRAQLKAAEAQVAAATALVAISVASEKYNKATNLRFKELSAKVKGAVSERELDQYQALEEQATATKQQADGNLELAQANLVSAKLNYDWTKVTAPIDGHISRSYLTLGNLVNQDATQLTTVVSMDPMYVYFDIDEPTMLRIKRAINAGTISSVIEGVDPMPRMGASTLAMLATPVGLRSVVAASALVGATTMAEVPVDMELQGEDDYEHRGTFNFIDNQVNPATGSISVRGLFPNPKPARGTHTLVPGMFVRIRLQMGQPYSALLVIDRAVTADQGLKYVYVLDADNKVQQRRVKTGPLQEDGLRVIEKATYKEESGKKVIADGLLPSDWVIVGSLQQVRPRMVIQPDRLKDMPSMGGSVPK